MRGRKRNQDRSKEMADMHYAQFFSMIQHRKYTELQKHYYNKCIQNIHIIIHIVHLDVVAVLGLSDSHCQDILLRINHFTLSRLCEDFRETLNTT